MQRRAGEGWPLHVGAQSSKLVGCAREGIEVREHAGGVFVFVAFWLRSISKHALAPSSSTAAAVAAAIVVAHGLKPRHGLLKALGPLRDDSASDTRRLNCRKTRGIVAAAAADADGGCSRPAICAIYRFADFEVARIAHPHLQQEKKKFGYMFGLRGVGVEGREDR